MTTEMTVKKQSAIEALASRLEVSKETLQATLKATAFACCKTNEEFVSAVIVANTYKLNPLLGEIYAFPTKGGAVKPIVPIDGWISLVNRNPNNDGVELIENRGKLNSKTGTDVESVTAKFHIKGQSHPVTVTEYMCECFDATKTPWVKWPIRMLRHKAYIQGARVAYGFSGIYDPDEGERIVEAEIVSGIKDPASIQMPQPKTLPSDPEATSPRIEASPVETSAPGGELSEEEKEGILKNERSEAEAAQALLNARKAKAKANA